MTATRSALYSPRTGAYLRDLAAERDVPTAGRTAAEATTLARIEDVLGNHPIFDPESDRFVSQAEASAAIEYLRSLPRRGRKNEVDEALTPGVYELPDGTVYVVKPNQAKTRLYAKRLVEINADRLTEVDTVVQIEFEYEQGAIFKIRSEHRMPLERAKALTVRYSKCINCARRLKAAKSVEQGIGPVCVKAFR
jgi:hypothetical protein